MSETTISRAYAKNVTQAPRKVSIVASLIRNRTVEDALVILKHVQRAAAEPIITAIESAKANAINNHAMDSKTLRVKTISITTGVRLKRYVPASRGRALPYQKKTSNILVEVEGELKPKKAVSTTKTTVKKESK